jgi:hypothetical protein
MIGKVIAGVALVADGDQDIIDHGIPAADAPFYASPPDVSADHRIHLRLHIDRAPDFTNAQLVFDADGSWFICKDDSCIWIVLHPPVFDAPLWIARMAPDFSQGHVYYNEKAMGCRISYPLDQILMMHVLARIGGMLIHAAGWAINNAGWMFAGKSGAGKSTISNLIVEATGGTFLSDDRIIIRKIGPEFFMYGTPWPGDAGYAVNDRVPLKGIFFLSKGEENAIRALRPADAISRLMPVASIPWYDREKVDLMMTFCDDLLAAIPVYELTFVPDQTAVFYLEKFINAG